jgi:hypothetical protein
MQTKGAKLEWMGRVEGVWSGISHNVELEVLPTFFTKSIDVWTCSTNETVCSLLLFLKIVGMTISSLSLEVG